MKLLPVELLYCVGEFLELFDQINMNYALKMNIPIRNIKDAVDNFSNDPDLQLILYKIVTIERRIDNFDSLKDIFKIIKHNQICWRNCNLVFNFTLKKGKSLITQNSEYNFNIVCKNPILLENVLVKYFEFEIIKEQNLSFPVKCNIKYMLPRGH
jgi:hypothetical protein